MARKNEGWSGRLDRKAQAFCEARERLTRAAMLGEPNESLLVALRLSAFEVAQQYVEPYEGR
jgi:hypothetical protein